MHLGNNAPKPAFRLCYGIPMALNPFLTRVANSVHAFRDCDRERPLTLASLEVFLAVALNPAASLDEIEKATGLSQTMVSRTIATLTEAKAFEKPGMGLIEAVTDPRKRNTKRLFLTAKGRTVAEDMALGAAFETLTPQQWLDRLTPLRIGTR